ncbi:MAG: DnaJ domain-containing protein [Chloroflexi bacterium]|nr:DnaJ domain-containing protein [Chloroflexota bacterium]
MPKRDPHAVLGVSPGASVTAIKAAWRRLARQHHPDLASADPAAVRAATRQMAEINAAYEALRPNGKFSATAGNGRRASGPPKPRPTKPVTGRVDMTSTFRPRNATTGPRAYHDVPRPPVTERFDREPPRASDPNGPLSRARVPHFRTPPLPPLEQAEETVLEFGKFHGHTLGEIAAFEPSYIDWLTRTIARDPDLVAAARAVQADLDARGIHRRPRPEPVRPAPARSSTARPA